VARALAHAGPSSGPSMFLNPGVSFSDAIEALGILVAAGSIAGMIPAQRAIVVSPVVALRSE
jgi:putative ABC transport system permease protein